MKKFQLKRDYLLKVVNSCEQRTFAQDVELLMKRGKDMHWLIAGLNSNDKKGIDNNPKQMEIRRQKYGSNKKKQIKLATFCELFYDAINDFILKILIVAAIFSIIVEVSTADQDHLSTAWIQGFAVLMAVLISSLITTINNYQKQRQFQKLNNVADQRKKVTVRRDGVIQSVHKDDLLVGDIVSVSQGMEVPADALLIQSSQIQSDESAMTGQAEPIPKNILEYCIRKKTQAQINLEKSDLQRQFLPSPVLMSGTKILKGQGKMIVIVVGQLSCIGRVTILCEAKTEELTPLQVKLQYVAERIGKFGLFSALFILAVLLIRFSIEKGISKDFTFSRDIKQILDYIIIAITVVVVAIPEGLPLSVTLSLAVSVKQMLEDSNLVRKMQACETMGGANNICSDKTGTLTLNKMQLTKIWNGKVHNIQIYDQKDNNQIQELSSNKQFMQLFRIGLCVNSTAFLEPQQKGSSTEVAILKYMKSVGINYEQYREQKYPPKLKYPFHSSRKRMSVVIELQSQNSLVIFTKGASEMVLDSCNKWYNMEENKVEIISHGSKEKIENVIHQMAEDSLRTLCVAYKKIGRNTDLERKDEKGIYDVEKSQLTLLGILGVRDNPRPQVPQAIRKCHIAGITVRMVTGDNIITAKAIAKDVGIIKQNSDAIVMEGSQFIKIVGGVVCKQCRTKICECPTDIDQAKQLGKQLRVDTIFNAQQFDRIKDRLLVLARSRPEDKYALVVGLKQRGQVVAVTGDGTNDAPALKKADVGFAMGITGTEVARQAAAIILLDDNFNSIVKAVIWGRNIYDSIRKFIQFQLTVNVVAVFITLIGAAIIKQQILLPIQMIWINLIMDTLASLALATEAPNEKLLERKPHGRQDNIVSTTMFKHIIGQSLFQLIVLVILVFAGQYIIPEEKGFSESSVYTTNPSYKYRDGYVRSGRFITILGQNDYKDIFQETDMFSRHFTFIFNTFVMMQIFNFVCCRKIQNQFNIFEGIGKNKLFILVVACIMVLQAIIITFAGQVFGVHQDFGLTAKQWGLCIGFGSITWIVNFLLKFVPQPKQHQQKESPTGQQSIGRLEYLQMNKKQSSMNEQLPQQSPANFSSVIQVRRKQEQQKKQGKTPIFQVQQNFA